MKWKYGFMHTNSFTFNFSVAAMTMQKYRISTIRFFFAVIAEETSGTGSDHKANTVAQFVAAVFLKIDRPVRFGTKPSDSSEPSTPFGRAVRDALVIFKVYRKPKSTHLPPEIAHWKRPTERAVKSCQKPN